MRVTAAKHVGLTVLATGRADDKEYFGHPGAVAMIDGSVALTV
jgi:hypothetical protein